jgi:Glycosyl transferase family 2
VSRGSVRAAGLVAAVGMAAHRVRSRRRGRARREPPAWPDEPGVVAVVPVLNEADAIGPLVRELHAAGVRDIVIVDGGSTDGTPSLAAAAGARVVHEPRRGYGWACAAGVAASEAPIILFLDGDGSDDPAYASALIAPIRAGRAELVLGARRVQPGRALPVHQRLGNRFVGGLLSVLYGVRLHDVPPMRAVRRDTLQALSLTEMTYGWPTQMMVMALRAGAAIEEVEVAPRPRHGGASKIAGRFLPSLAAGARMIRVVVRDG